VHLLDCVGRLSEGEQIIVNTSTDGSLAAIENSITTEFQEISGICLSTLATIYRYFTNQNSVRNFILVFYSHRVLGDYNPWNWDVVELDISLLCGWGSLHNEYYIIIMICII
jgi:hypothetical protein